MARAVEKLEQEFAAQVGALGAVATGFGRSALRLALEALAVRGGDVLVPDFVCAQVPEAVRCAGGHPVFYPVQRDLTVARAGFELAFTPGTRAAIVVHPFGRLLPQVVELAEICRVRTVTLVEDGALALGATHGGYCAGAFGRLAVFSLTKSVWCYGGGLVTSNSREMLEQLRALRERKLRADRSLALRYGWLRRADFAANRPTWSRMTEQTGRWLERLLGPRGENFYEAGRFDAALPEFAVRRARRVVAELASTTARRRHILSQLCGALQGPGQILLRPETHPGEAASFLLLVCPANRVEVWIEQAAGKGVSLRRSWPTYQVIEGLAPSRDVMWLAEHLLILEIHPNLSAAEIRRTVSALSELGLRADATNTLRNSNVRLTSN